MHKARGWMVRLNDIDLISLFASLPLKPLSVLYLPCVTEPTTSELAVVARRHYDMPVQAPPVRSDMSYSSPLDDRPSAAVPSDLVSGHE